MREFTINSKTIEQLEFDKVRAIVMSNCKGEGGTKLIQDQNFDISIDSLFESLKTIEDFTKIICLSEDTGLYDYEFINEELYFLEKEGYVLEAGSIIKILRVLKNYDSFISSFSKEKSKLYPYLVRAIIIEGYSHLPIKEIERVLDEEGNIKNNASSALVKIFKRIESVTRQLDSEFNNILTKYKDLNVLADNVESWRNGRRVLVLPVENKRKVAGVIHDQSSSGKTVFIEPEGVMRINNELFSLDSEKRAEIYKILKELSANLRQYRGEIAVIFEKLSIIDACRAKALFSLSVNGVVPKLTEQAGLTLGNVRHPLLHLQLEKSNKEAVPFDLNVKGQNRLLLISGPNAGGKSVTLKAVGLVHLMTYFGLLIPVSESSEIGIFNSIYTDIGDQQSIDEGLSTYSSHLTNLNDIVKSSTKKSLVLLDEIGSGTDPKLGGAIAEGILKALLAKKVYGIITTHYSSLKVFAFRNPGILNGAMLFDKDNLQPTYKLKVGKPGSSYAFEVAKKIGLDERIINYARKKVGKKENQIEELLIDLQEGKAIIDEQLDYIKNEKQNLEKLIRNYKQLNEDFQLKRKKLQIKSKEIVYQKSHKENIELQKVINELQKEKNIEKARELKQKAFQKRKNYSDSIVELKNEVSEVRGNNLTIAKGSFVRLLDSDMSGEVLQLMGEKAEVIFGLMKMQVPLKELVPTGDPLEFKQNRINLKGVAFDNNFSPKIDIRGYKMSDAEDTLQEFFDRALLSSAKTLEIVHGKGSGVLRKLVINKMKEYNDLISYWHPADEAGGEGVTMIKM